MDVERLWNSFSKSGTTLLNFFYEELLCSVVHLSQKANVRNQTTLKRSWGRLEHSNRSTMLILELCGMREQGV